MKKVLWLAVCSVLGSSLFAAAELPSKCVDFGFSELNGSCFKRVGAYAKYGVFLVDDADAVNGKALAFEVHPKQKNVHAHAFSMGIFRRKSGKGQLKIEIPKKDLPQDEKYHFHFVGDIVLFDDSTFWAHRSWAIQQFLDSFYDAENPKNNKVAVYASIKFTGPAYVKGSSNKDGVYVDRIVLARTGTLPKTGAKAALPAEFEGKELFDIVHGNFTSVKKMAKNGLVLVDDADAVSGKAMAVLKSRQGHKLPFRMGIFSNKDQKSLAYKQLGKEQIPQDEKYHLYPLGKVTLDKDAFFWGHASWAMQQNFASYINAEKPENNKVEVFVSLKFTGPAYVENSTSKDGVYIDRFLLVLPASK
ncbi:MAG: hypothetical protein IKD23_00320 [Lentisphaeria bacterium]|nr:hypothetical protein [Lentisphaeria bacterium]